MNKPSSERINVKCGKIRLIDKDCFLQDIKYSKLLSHEFDDILNLPTVTKEYQPLCFVPIVLLKPGESPGDLLLPGTPMTLLKQRQNKENLSVCGVK